MDQPSYDDSGHITGYTPTLTITRQAGGAFVANLYDGNGDPAQIAHVMVPWQTIYKGGGAPHAQALLYNANDAANALKDRFNDRSNADGVNLQTGETTFSSPVLESIGQGDFPYKLERKLEVRGPGIVFQGAVRPKFNTIDDGIVTNWDAAAIPSNSGREAMGATRADAAATTIAAFVAMQDIWNAPPSPQRETAGLLAPTGGGGSYWSTSSRWSRARPASRSCASPTARMFHSMAAATGWR